MRLRTDGYKQTTLASRIYGPIFADERKFHFGCMPQPIVGKEICFCQNALTPLEYTFKLSLSSSVRIFDATAVLQNKILQACSTQEQQKIDNRPSSSGEFKAIASIQLEKGDYAVQTLQIPKYSSVTLFSKDSVRILYIGKRNRPMFLLGENSMLTLKEKLEIYYNSNNVQEVMKLMIRKSSVQDKIAHAEISKGVKISLFSQKI